MGDRPYVNPRGWKLVYNDEKHTYTLNGRRCKSITAVAKIAPDSFALEQWRKRQVAIGMTLEPRLLERIAVDPDNKHLVDKVCEEAMRVAGSHHAADRGTQRHRASELFDLAEPMLTDQQRADAAAWQRTIEAYGIEILPEFVEGFAIWPHHGVTGRFDRIARYQGRHIILDLKSGKNAVAYPQGTAVQLALYANAPLISAETKTNGDQSTVTRWRQPPDDLDLETGYVVLLADEMDVGELWKVNIGHGMAGARDALNLVNWRKEHGFGKYLAEKVEPTSVVHNGVDNLLQQINDAADEKVLLQLWITNEPRWTEIHTAAAKRRKQQLADSPASLVGSK